MNMRPIAHAFTPKGTMPPHRNAAAMGFLRFRASGRVEVLSQVPAWAHRNLHRLQPHPLGTPKRPVSEGPRNASGQVVRQTRCGSNRCRHGALGGCFDGERQSVACISARRAMPECDNCWKWGHSLRGSGRGFDAHPLTFKASAGLGKIVLGYHPWATYGETELRVLQSYPQWLDRDAWLGFEEMRQSMPKSKPFTQRAALLVLKRLQEIKDAGHCPNAALDQSTLNGWAGVWPAKQEQIEPARYSDADRTAAYLASEAEHRRSLRAVK